jgi:hypothetical protein
MYNKHLIQQCTLEKQKYLQTDEFIWKQAKFILGSVKRLNLPDKRTERANRPKRKTEQDEPEVWRKRCKRRSTTYADTKRRDALFEDSDIDTMEDDSEGRHGANDEGQEQVEDEREVGTKSKDAETVDNSVTRKVPLKKDTSQGKMLSDYLVDVDELPYDELADTQIVAYLAKLKAKYGHKRAGLEDPGLGFCVKGVTQPRFSAADKKPFVQVINITDHWICVSNVGSPSANEVVVYDSYYDTLDSGNTLLQV